MHSSSDFYNYEGFYSTVLMASAAYDYKFLTTDVWVQGRTSNRGIIKNSALYYAMENNTLQFPPPCPLPLLSNEFYNTKEYPPICICWQ